MNDRRKTEALLDDVTLADLRFHLVDRGWKQVAERNARLFVYRLVDENNGHIELLLPYSEQFVDAKSRIADAIAALSQIEGKSVNEISSEVKRVNRDSLRIRLQVNEDAVSIPLGQAPQHVQGIKNLLLYAACSEVQVARHFEVPLSAGFKFVNECQFGHTFRGSFGFEVSTKLAKEQETLDVFSRPFSRRSMERIVRGFESLRKAVDEDDPDFLVDSFEHGFNARMCEALTEIALRGEVVFDCEVEWASAAPPADDLREFRTVHIGPSEVSVLSYAADQLKAIGGMSDEIIGTVVNLHCARNPSDDASKRIVAIKTKHRQYGAIEVRMQLGANRYLKAVEAHTAGKWVMIRGILERKGNTWSMNAITHFDALAG